MFLKTFTVSKGFNEIIVFWVYLSLIDLCIFRGNLINAEVFTGFYEKQQYFFKWYSNTQNPSFNRISLKNHSVFYKFSLKMIEFLQDFLQLSEYFDGGIVNSL